MWAVSESPTSPECKIVWDGTKEIRRVDWSKTTKQRQIATQRKFCVDGQSRRSMTPRHPTRRRRSLRLRHFANTQINVAGDQPRRCRRLTPRGTIFPPHARLLNCEWCLCMGRSRCCNRVRGNEPQNSNLSYRLRTGCGRDTKAFGEMQSSRKAGDVAAREVR